MKFNDYFENFVIVNVFQNIENINIRINNDIETQKNFFLLNFFF